MLYKLLADVVLLIHTTFVAFVVIGAVFVLRWPRIAWLHVPCAVWGALIEFGGWICPLTPLENALRRRGGEAGYRGGFIEHYVSATIYPPGLTRNVQYALGAGVIVLNVLIYAWAIRRARRSTPTT